jgi:uncharacterized protein YjbI with pentapeptide repeats
MNGRHLIALGMACATLFLPVSARGANSEYRQILEHCTGCDVAGIDLHNADLSGVHIVGADMARVNLRNANLRNATFTGVDFNDAVLDGADLRGASFVGASLRGTSFVGAHLDDLRLIGVKVDARNLSSDDRRAFLHTCTGCDLAGLDLGDSDLRDVRLVGDDLANANLHHTNLDGSDLAGADLRHGSLQDATLGNMVLCRPNRQVTSSGNTYSQTHTITFDSDRMGCADLREADLRGTDFSRVRVCEQGDAREDERCRLITRKELTDFAHANLAGAVAPTT